VAEGLCRRVEALPLRGDRSLLSPGCPSRHWHRCLGTSPCCWENWEGTTAPTSRPGAALLSPEGSKDSHSQRCLEADPRCPPTSPCKRQHNLPLKCHRQVLSQACVLKGLYSFEKAYLVFLTSRKSKNLYLSLGLVVCSSNPPSLPSCLPPTHRY